MVYNFNLGIGWASSGVEYAQAYRAKLLRGIGQEAKFIFTDMFPQENIQHMTENIGFLDSEVIWLYTFFTDLKISPVTFTLRQLERFQELFQGIVAVATCYSLMLLSEESNTQLIIIICLK